jgi:hypothetical protein
MLGAPLWVDEAWSSPVQQELFEPWERRPCCSALCHSNFAGLTLGETAERILFISWLFLSNLMKAMGIP